MTAPLKVPTQYADCAWEYRAGYRAGHVHGDDEINPVQWHDDAAELDSDRADAWDAGRRAGMKARRAA